MENRKRIIELLTAVRYTTNDIEKVADKICSLFNVSQQRELLIDYSNYLRKEYFNRHLEPDYCDVDEYLKSINRA